MPILSNTIPLINPGLNVPVKVLPQDLSRVGIEIFNDGSVSADFIGIVIGEPMPDLSKFVAIILPYGSWWPPADICIDLSIWLVWLTNNGLSKAYITTYTKA